MTFETDARRILADQPPEHVDAFLADWAQLMEEPGTVSTQLSDGTLIPWGSEYDRSKRAKLVDRDVENALKLLKRHADVEHVRTAMSALSLYIEARDAHRAAGRPSSVTRAEKLQLLRLVGYARRNLPDLRISWKPNSVFYQLAIALHGRDLPTNFAVDDPIADYL